MGCYYLSYKSFFVVVLLKYVFIANGIGILMMSGINSYKIEGNNRWKEVVATTRGIFRFYY